MNQNNYIITGVAPTSSSGTGDLLLYLKNHKNFKIAWKPNSFIYVLKEILISFNNRGSNLLDILISLIRYWLKIYPNIKFKNFKKSKKLNFYLFHPQTISYKFANKIANLNISKAIYLLDNSYFCFASYNWLNKEPFNSCIKCLENKNDFLVFDCKDIFNNKVKDYLEFRENLKKGNFGKIFVQNHSQQKLFSIFSTQQKALVVGMLPQSLLIKRHSLNKNRNNQILKIFTEKKSKFKFAVVCHMNNSGPKGYHLIKETSKYLREVCFIFPFKCPIKDLKDSKSSNLIYLPCRWNNGLMQICERADMVIIPSVWSVQVEAALLKSCNFSKRVSAIAESIVDKRDYIKGVNYLSTSNGNKEFAFEIRKVLHSKENQKTLRKSLAKYISSTENSLEKLFLI